MHKARCQCGKLSVRSEADPDFNIVCNCKACQRRTGSPFGTALYFRKSDLVIDGPSQTWERGTDSGRKLENHFCPDCGTTLYWTLELRPDHVGVAYGCFETPVAEPMRAIWTEEKHAWVSFPEAWPTYPKGSPS